MLSVLNNRRQLYNKNIMDYCRKSTEESVKRIIEREKPKNTILIQEELKELKELKEFNNLSIIKSTLYKYILTFINNYIFSFKFRHLS
jgi:hypothetical protein